MYKKLNIVVISIKSAYDRRLSISNQLNDYILFDAIKGSDFNDCKLINGLELNIGRKPSLGEVGCILSHLEVWNKFYHCDWLIVLEDDALVESNFHKLCSDISSIPADYNPKVYMLGHCQTLKRNLWLQRLKQPLFNTIMIGNFKFGENYAFNMYGSTGYIMNKGALSSLSSVGFPSWLMDDWARWREVTGIKIYHPKIPFIYENVKFSTQTGNIKKVRHNPLANPIFELTAVFVIQFFKFFKKSYFRL